MSREGDQRLVEARDEAALGDAPYPHPAVLTGACDNIVIEWVPFNI